jgi:hypothetical protein
MTSQGRKRDKKPENNSVSPGTSSPQIYDHTHTHTWPQFTNCPPQHVNTTYTLLPFTGCYEAPASWCGGAAVAALLVVGPHIKYSRKVSEQTIAKFCDSQAIN